MFLVSMAVSLAVMGKSCRKKNLYTDISGYISAFIGTRDSISAVAAAST